MYTHFPELPKVIQMDNSCNVENFCLNREPAYFGSTAFVIDQFHYEAHNNCSPAYNTSKPLLTYPSSAACSVCQQMVLAT